MIDRVALVAIIAFAFLGIVFTGVATPPATPGIIVSIAKVSQ